MNWLSYLTGELDRLEESEVRVPAVQVAMFWRQLAVLFANGVPLVRAVEVLRRQSDNLALRMVLERCHERLLNGHRFSHTLRSYPGVFTQISVGLVVSGESTGALVCSLERIAELEERGLRRRATTVTALAYPVLLLVCTLLVGLLFVTFVAPGDSGLYALAGGHIPWPSRVLMAMSNLNVWLALALIGALLVIFASRLYARYPLPVDAWLLRLPGIGGWLRASQAARVLDVLSSSLPAGFAVIEALKLARHVCTNREFARRFSGTIEQIYEGQGMGESLRSTELFPPFVTASIEVAEEVGKLDATLIRLCQSVDEQVQDALEEVTRLIAPLFLALAGVLAGFLALAIFLPSVAVTMSL